MTFNATDAYAESKNLYISFSSMHVSSFVKFKAFITSFSQEFSTNWNSQTVFGRMDPIQTFQNTQRTITLAFKTTSINAVEAKENLDKINRLTKMLYPTYDDPGSSANSTSSNALTMAKPPLMRVKFTNWIQGGPGGLICAVGGFSYDPDFLEEGAFDYRDALLPKTINVSCTLNVLHEHDLGWSNDKWIGNHEENIGRGGSSFPFAISSAISEAISPDPTPAAPTPDTPPAEAEKNKQETLK